MKILITYSSRTGNTKKVAEAIRDALPGEAELIRAEQLLPEISGYDVVFAGFWADRGTANQESAAVLKRLHGQKVAVFGTCGAYADSEHARECLDNAAALVPSDSKVFSTWICQGKVDPKIVEMMAAMFPAGHPHSMTPERIARLEEAKKHPSEEDLRKAGEWAIAVIEGAQV